MLYNDCKKIINKMDERYKTQYFNSNLSIRYKPCVMNKNWKTKRWYKIDKEVAGDWFFPDDYFTTIEEKKWISSFIK